MRERWRGRWWWWWEGGRSCCLSPATCNLHCSLGIDWGSSERDRHTVTGKMNCHLAFLSLLAASNWPLWTMWRDTDWVPPPPLLSSKGKSWFNFKCAGSPCKVSGITLCLCLYSKAFTAALFFFTAPRYFSVLLRYSASQPVVLFLWRIVMAVWQSHRGGKLLGVAIWILEAILGSIKTLTLAKSLVSLSYHADGVGNGCSRSGTRETGASGRPVPPDPVEPDSDGGWLSRISQAGL